MSTLFDNLIDGSDQLYFDDLNSAPTTGDEPTITGVGTLRYTGSATITGTNFGASQGAGGVTIGGVSQPILSWSDTSISIGPIARGALRYATHNVVVSSDEDGSSSPSAQPLLPQTGWSFVTLVAPLATAGQRITSTPDLAVGDQLAWGNIAPSGTVTVASDASFTSAGAGSFDVEVNDGTGWGSFATQVIAAVAAFSGLLTAGAASISGAFSVTVPEPPVAEFPFSGSLVSSPSSMAGTFLAFTSKGFDGTLVADDASIFGAFNVIGVVSPSPSPSPTPTPPPGTGTPASKVAIVNIGLVCLGVPMIRSFQDDSKAARLASQMFDRVRDAELARHIWKFAFTRRNLPEYVSDEPRGSYKYAYAKPVDWLQTVWIGKETLGTPGAAFDPENADWSHEDQYILTNFEPPLPLQYIRRITDPTKYHVLFNEVLGRRFAMEWSDALTDSQRKWEKARVEYREQLSEARRANAILDPPRSQPADSWLTSRY